MKGLMAGALARREASGQSRQSAPIQPEHRPLAAATGFVFAIELIMRSGSE
jgi:hypothetical protein